jgi:predicted PurR-regulated permease PerM
MLGIDARAARCTWTAALIVLFLVLVYILRTTLFVFMVALLFAYFLSPLVSLIDRLLPASRTRTPALAIAYVILVAALFVGITQIGGRAVEEANALAKAMPALLDRLQASANAQSLNPLQAQILERVQELVARSSGDIIAWLPIAGAKLIGLASNLLYVVVIPILGFFFLRDGRSIRAHLLETVDEPGRRAMLDDLLDDVNRLLAHYIRAIALLSLTVFICYAVFFTILRIPYSILLAAVAGALEFIPMIGPFGAGCLILIVTIVSGGPVLAALAFLLVYRILQDYGLSPLLMGKGVQLHPLVILFGVFAGTKLAGVAGAFLSVPVLALLRIVYVRIRKSTVSA